MTQNTIPTDEEIGRLLDVIEANEDEQQTDDAQRRIATHPGVCQRMISGTMDPIRFGSARSFAY